MWRLSREFAVRVRYAARTSVPLARCYSDKVDIPIALVKELRQRTSAGVADCKNALVETKGDMDAAIALLQKKLGDKAAKLQDRVASEGLIVGARAEDASKASIVEVSCSCRLSESVRRFRAFLVEFLFLFAIM
jgi:translation elongation factor EF-Ts